jgi:uncharacterized protein (UPF0179 family)
VNENLLFLHGLDCAKCHVPAHCHDFATGLTYHVDARKNPCQTQIPRR